MKLHSQVDFIVVLNITYVISLLLWFKTVVLFIIKLSCDDMVLIIEQRLRFYFEYKMTGIRKRKTDKMGIMKLIFWKEILNLTNLRNYYIEIKKPLICSCQMSTVRSDTT